jgi:hypothetical protein
MAIWSYRAELIPRQWILREYGEIPAILHREQSIEAALDQAPHALAKEHASRWLGIHAPPDFIARAEAILPVMERSSTLIHCGSRDSHRIELWIDDDTPDLIGIQLDLRQPDIDLFTRIAGYARHLDTLIVPDDRFTVVAPDIDDLLDDLRESRAYHFCSNPTGCLQQIPIDPAAD